MFRLRSPDKQICWYDKEEGAIRSLLFFYGVYAGSNILKEKLILKTGVKKGGT
jgi:hypothetical protein